MRIGAIIPQGWTGEFAGWDPAGAWHRSVELAVEAERLGFESIWAFDHFHTVPVARDEITFESSTFLTALAARTERVRIGHLVASAGYRNPALLAKMIGTLDVISGGRAELGIGAGWKRDEWEAYGYSFAPTSERLAVLAEQLEVITAMLAPGRATYDGAHASVREAINEPRGLQEPAVPIMVGGNGRQVTWRLAARYADELNLDAMSPDDVAEALPVIEARCREAGREPASLRISVHIWWEHLPTDPAGMERLLTQYAELGLSRVQTLMRSAVEDPEALPRLAEAAGRAGVTLEPTTVA